MSAALTPAVIIFNANKIMKNQELLQKHMWKSKPCHFGVACNKDISECPAAHFLEEFRVPICLYLHMCNKQDCHMYHPNMGTADEYIKFMGIDKVLPTHENWCSTKARRDNIVKCAKYTISNSELLREHLMKTRQCFHGSKCKNKQSCSGAHYLEEYRLPICLYLEFCQEKSCKAFHPNSGKTKEQFMQENNIKLPSKKLHMDTKPLTEPNEQAIPSKQIVNSKANTILCSFVKDKSTCKRTACSFAHSIQDLILPFNTDGMSLEKKREMVERMTKKKVPDFFMNPSHMNSEYLKMMKKQVDLVDELKQNENESDSLLCARVLKGQSFSEDEKNIEEILDVIDQEYAKEEFLQELELLEMMMEMTVDIEEFHFEPEEDNKYEEEEEDEEDEENNEYKVKISIASISQLEKLEKMEDWEKMKKQTGQNLWGDESDGDEW